MGFLDVLFQPGLLLFTVPVLIAVMLWSLALIGLLDFEAFDFDLDFDADVDLDADFNADLEAGGGGVLAAMGLGLVPFSLIFTLILFFFGFTGIALHSLFGAFGGGMAATNLIFVPLAVIVAITLSAGASRVLHPLFKDYGKAHGAFDLIGKTAVLKSSTVSPTFGAAIVKIDGDRMEIATRSETADNGLRYGDKVLVIDFDQEKNLYMVAPFEQKMIGE